MDKKHQVHNLIILDESGSMSSIKQSIIQGFNELMQTIQAAENQFPEQEHYISFLSFNSLGEKWLHYMEPVSKLKAIDDEKYNPNSLTPLFDAMGFAINKLKQSLEDKNDYNVLVTILTDGYENASKEFSGNDVKKLIEELKQNKWTFTYIGTDHDVEKVTSSLSINNTFIFLKSDVGLKKMFHKEKESRFEYYSKIKSNIDFNSKYFRNNNKNKNS